MSQTISYAEILKRAINKTIIPEAQVLVKSIESVGSDGLDNVGIFDLNNMKNNKNHIINTLVRKILKNNKSDTSYPDIVKRIKSIISNTDDNVNNISDSILKINQIISQSKYKNLSDINPNHSYVADNLSNILRSYNYTSDTTILDIGGGDGTVVKLIGEKLNIDSKNLYSLEEADSTWIEKYQFTNDINYLFWNNIDIQIDNDTDDKIKFDIIICMVSLHHMNNQTINNLFLNINRLLKKDGLIILKEHDAISRDSMRIIDWEHHLYHIMKSPDDLDLDSVHDYLNGFINNYKSKLAFDELFESNGYDEIIELDRFFNKFVEYDSSNITRLYWKIYKKL